MKARGLILILITFLGVNAQVSLGYLDLEGNTHELPTDQTIIVEIFATWCENCQAQHSALSEVYSSYPSFPLYSLSSSSKDSVADVLLYNQSFPTSWNLGIDDGGHLFKKYSVEGYPTFLVLNDGELQACLVGVQSKSTLGKLFDMVLAEDNSLSSEFGTSCEISGQIDIIFWGLAGSGVLVVYFIWSSRRKQK